jgi:tripartite-type tricarboxylate transporter receptor subunit TctC
MHRKFAIGKVLIGLFWGISVFAFPGFATLWADDFPTKPISLVIPLSAGGSNDLTARTFVGLSPEVLGQPMIIQIKPGGGGAIGSELVAQAKPDGHTLLFGHSNCNSVLPASEGRSKGPDDLTPVCRINIMDYVLAVRSDAPFKTFTEMIAWAKANPGKLTFGSIGGARSWMGFEWLWQEEKAGIKTRIVPYDGGGETLVALLGGHIQVTMTFLTQYLPHFRAGKLRPLAVYGAKRYPELPNVPTVTEEGFVQATPGGIWKGVMAPKGTPRPAIDKLALGFKKMTENKQVVENLKKLGDDFSYLGPDEFEKFWREDYETFKKLALKFK